MDGPPIHGNTRLEVIWTAIPAILLVALCTYAYVVLRDIEEAQAPTRDAASRHRRAVRVDLRVPAGGRQADRAPTSSTCRADQSVQFNVQLQGRHPRLLGPGLPHEDRRGARASRPATASRPTRSATTRSSAPSCAASATRTCARPRTSSRRPTSTRGSPSERARPARRRRRRRRRGPAARRRRRRRGRRQGDLHRGAQPACGGCHTLADAGHDRHDRARTSTRSLKGKDAAFIQRVDRRSRRRDRAGLPAGHHARRTSATRSPAGARRARELPRAR